MCVVGAAAGGRGLCDGLEHLWDGKHGVTGWERLRFGLQIEHGIMRRLDDEGTSGILGT